MRRIGLTLGLDLPRLPWQSGRSYYADRDVSVTDAERALLDREDLAGFWASRLLKDPVARVGVASWGGRRALATAIDPASDADLVYWRPRMSLLLQEALALRTPASVTIPAETPDELTRYWAWTGDSVGKRLTAALVAANPARARDNDWLERQRRTIGLALARAHVDAVDRDLQDGQGDIPGVLSREQVAEYHHRVFARFGLPPSTYGGTQLRFLPDELELELTGAIYAHDSDEGGTLLGRL